MTANINSMFYYGEKPWHGLGKHVENVLTSAEAIQAAGLDWTVKAEAISYQFGGQTRNVPDQFAIVRQDNGAALGVVGRVYKALQNREAFSIADAIVGVKEAMYHTAGALGAGERVWLLLKLPGYVRTLGDDVTEKYLLVSNSHDGSSAVQVMFTPIRVVCQNTLNIAIASATNRARVRHTLNMGTKIDQIRDDLGIINKRFALLEAVSGQLARAPFKAADIKALAAKSGLVPDAEKSTTRAQNILDEVSRLFETGKGADLPAARGTAWGAFNAVVEYVDHGRGPNPEKRAESLLYGSGAQIKQAAWNQVLDLAGITVR